MKSIRTYLLRIKVFLSVCIFLKQFARTVSEKLVICDLQLESSTVPSIVKVNIIRVDESQFLV